MIKHCRMIRLFQKSLTSRLTSRVCQAALSSHKRHHNASQEENAITITKVYNDEEGQSHFGSMEIKLKGSGEFGYSRLCCVLCVLYVLGKHPCTG